MSRAEKNFFSKKSKIGRAAVLSHRHLQADPIRSPVPHRPGAQIELLEGLHILGARAQRHNHPDQRSQDHGQKRLENLHILRLNFTCLDPASPELEHRQQPHRPVRKVPRNNKARKQPAQDSPEE